MRQAQTVRNFKGRFQISAYGMDESLERSVDEIVSLSEFAVNLSQELVDQRRATHIFGRFQLLNRHLQLKFRLFGQPFAEQSVRLF
ncbi:MAG TPA: hypothetical protein VJ810_05980 [Blastocatellia bacterium]|nr:hypothetical protein [Blastocatellia bacterium]